MELKTRGDAAYRAHRWTEAGKLYAEAVAADPALVAARANQAACAIQLCDWSAGLNACDAALTMTPAAQPIPAQLKTKILWRKAICLRRLHTNRVDWENTVQAGLEVDTTQTLRKESEYVFVTVVYGMPPEYTSRVGMRTEPKRTVPPPQLPLTYNGLLQLQRSPTPETHRFWYEMIEERDLRDAVSSGVEPDTLEYVCKMILANPTEPKNRVFLTALQSSPRYSVAKAMSDSALLDAAKRIAFG